VITQIDVRGILARCSSERHCDLVTRPTGRAVRTSIESELAALGHTAVVVLDFTQVRILDCSCADEIVAKLVQASLASEAPGTTFLLRGLDAHQIEDVAEVLRRQELALVAETGGALRPIGAIAERERDLYTRLAELGAMAAAELADELGWPEDEVHATLEDLATRRLLVRDAGRYHTLSAA
jgi:hypothetical protein